jgi:hypothetical protein
MLPTSMLFAEPLSPDQRNGFRGEREMADDANKRDGRRCQNEEPARLEPVHRNCTVRRYFYFRNPEKAKARKIGQKNKVPPFLRRPGMTDRHKRLLRNIRKRYDASDTPFEGRFAAI